MMQVWDNRAALHRRDGFDTDSRRILYAAQVKGHKPFEGTDALSRIPRARVDLMRPRGNSQGFASPVTQFLARAFASSS